jgi:hypothetical protein
VSKSSVTSRKPSAGLVESIERRDGSWIELEVKDLSVLYDPRPVRGLRDHCDVPFDRPRNGVFSRRHGPRGEHCATTSTIQPRSS